MQFVTHLKPDVDLQLKNNIQNNAIKLVDVKNRLNQACFPNFFFLTQALELHFLNLLSEQRVSLLTKQCTKNYTLVKKKSHKVLLSHCL